MGYKVYVYGSRKAFPTDGLALGTHLPFDIFVNEGNVFTKVFSAGQRFGPEERRELLTRGAFVEALRTTAQAGTRVRRVTVSPPGASISWVAHVGR